MGLLHSVWFIVSALLLIFNVAQKDELQGQINELTAATEAAREPFTFLGEPMPNLGRLVGIVEAFRDNIEVTFQQLRERGANGLDDTDTLSWQTDDRDEAELVARMLSTESIKPSSKDTATGSYRVTVAITKPSQEEIR